jgi:hypothetical protein
MSEYTNWAEGRFPYDRLACGYCITQHELGYCIWEKHRELSEAAKKAGLVDLLNKMRKTTFTPHIEEIRKTFLKLRKKYRRFWT